MSCEKPCWKDRDLLGLERIRKLGVYSPCRQGGSGVNSWLPLPHVRTMFHAEHGKPVANAGHGLELILVLLFKDVHSSADFYLLSVIGACKLVV